MVTLPGRREGEELEVVMPSKATADAIRGLHKRAKTTEAVEAAQVEVTRAQGEIDEMETMIATDPVGFIIDNVPKEVIREVALALVTQKDIWPELQETLAGLSDPNELRVVQAEVQTARLTSREQLRKIADAKKSSRETARKIVEGIDLMVPVTEGITASRREQIIADVRQHVGDAVRSQKLTVVDPKDLPLLAAPALRQHGIDPLKAAEVLNQSLTGGKAPGSRPASTSTKKKTGAQFKEARAKKKRAAASTPAGGGAPAAKPNLPKGQRVEERIAFAKEHGIARLLGR